MRAKCADIMYVYIMDEILHNLKAIISHTHYLSNKNIAEDIIENIVIEMQNNFELKSRFKTPYHEFNYNGKFLKYLFFKRDFKIYLYHSKHHVC